MMTWENWRRQYPDGQVLTVEGIPMEIGDRAIAVDGEWLVSFSPDNGTDRRILNS
jgi:hypothetical protein